MNLQGDFMNEDIKKFYDNFENHSFPEITEGLVNSDKGDFMNEWISVEDRLPELGKKYIYRGIVVYVTYNPFNRESELHGWLFINPYNSELTWCQIFPSDLYRIMDAST